MRRLMQRYAWLGLAAGAIVAAVPIAPVSARPTHRAHHADATIKHVLLISVDGLHQSDVDWYVNQYPHSTLAQIATGGREYAKAQTPFPSDSFPGMTAQVTGGDPKVTGYYYDDEYNREFLAPGTTSCVGKSPGAETAYLETNDINLNRLDAGQGLPGLPGSILQMTGDPLKVLAPSHLPVNANTCKPVLPHQYIKVNTIFEVARAHGLRTAWSDKHPAYEAFNGPSGSGVQDAFDPEINSQALGYGDGNDWTTDNRATMQYDGYKVQAVLHQIDGYNHQGTERVGTPAIFGTNLQTISTAEKLPKSDGLTGGYLPGTATPGPLLTRALNWLNNQLATMVAHIHERGLTSSTAIILSAKHGQSPLDPRQLIRIDDGPIISAINGAWTAAHPGAPALIAQATDDDGMLLWLSEHTPAAAAFVKNWLLGHPATGNTVDGGSRTVPTSGLAKVYAGIDAARFIGVPYSDARVPDVIGIVKVGVVYTGGTKKIAEHGGDNPGVRDVPLIVYAPSVLSPALVNSDVYTKQIAPTILSLLGLDPHALAAVRKEHTQVLPGG